MKRDTVESTILAACLKSSNAARLVVDLLSQDTFKSKPDHPILFSILYKLLNSEIGYNKTALAMECDKGYVDKIYIAFLLTKDLPTEDELLYLIKDLKETNERELVGEFGRQLEVASEDRKHDMESIRGMLVKSLDILSPDKLRSSQLISTIGDEYISSILEPRDKIPTGFIDLDRVIGGLAKKELTLLAARPGMGKSTLTLAMSYNAARSGFPVSFYGFEMAKEKLYEKLLSHHGNIPYFILDTRPPEQVKRWLDTITRANETMRNLPIHMMDESSVPDLDSLEESIRYQVKKYKTELVVVDYLQLVKVRGMADDYKKTAEVSNRLKKIAKANNVAILAASQMSRTIEHDDERLPKNSDLRDAGEQDAAYILFILRRRYGKEFNEKCRMFDVNIPFSETSLYLTKNRFSGGNEIILPGMTFIKPYNKYVNTVWDNASVEALGCPKCQSAQVRMKRGKLSCPSCGLDEYIKEEDSRSGLMFKFQEANVFGKRMDYEYAFLHSGYHGHSIIQDIKKVSSVVTPEDGNPVKRPMITGNETMPPITLGSEEVEDYHNE